MARLPSAAVTFALPLFAIAQAPINGPMPGYSECFESIIWLQCHGPCNAHIDYWREGAPNSIERTPVQQGDPAKAYAMDFVMDHVAPGTTYQYRVLLDNDTLHFPDTLRFHTQGIWKWRGDPPDFSFATGSCAYVNERPYDRPDGPSGPYGGDYGIFNSIAATHPDLMLWLGDNVYLREPDWGSWSGILHRYSHTRSLPELQPLLRATHHYAIWDDHDFGPNDADGSFINAALTTKAFDLFWPNPPCTMPGVGGIATSFTYADVDFFLLDDRSFRVPPDVLTDTPTMLGRAQIDHFIRALKYSDATFKIVALGGQLLNSADAYETYSTYPAERQWIIDRITQEGIKGVVFLTGDRHFTELSELDLPNGQPLYDLTVSPLTSGPYVSKEENKLAVPGTRVGQRNFGLLSVSGKRGARNLHISVRDKDGTELWVRDILQPAK
ncbi:MAG TPA: alkaline phosphatase D family protein [Flavobacteriales bacterium]|jgi:alkaline phosphatase D|nr:alkaline phosphatase D family protein [Flavobacteriales bacterium]